MAFFPLSDFFPTLCVVYDEDYAEAMEILGSEPPTVESRDVPPLLP